jgi:uncharacterized protein YjiS (DUF1127 family)
MSLNTHAAWHSVFGDDFAHTRPQTRRWPGLTATLVLWRQRRRTRQQLSALDDRALADVGLSRTQQRVECAKSPWQP